MSGTTVETVTVRAGELRTDDWSTPLGRSTKDAPDSLRAVIAYLGGVWAEIPEEYRDSAVVVTDMSGGYGEPECCDALAIYYDRPKTAEEYAAERAASERYEAERLASERAEFERLRRKFGA